MTRVLCICPLLPFKNAIRWLLFSPFYRWANQEPGNLRENSRCHGGYQFKPVSDLSALCAILLPSVESDLWGKSNFMSFAVSKGNAFPPSSQISAAPAFVMCSRWPQMAKLQAPVLSEKEETSVCTVYVQGHIGSWILESAKAAAYQPAWCL